MISDVLFEACEEIKRYLNDPVFQYDPEDPDILAVLDHMNRVRIDLDTPPKDHQP